MFLKALFWNIGKLKDSSILRDLCHSESIDLLMTAEDSFPDTLKEINKNGGGYKRVLATTKRGMNFYSKHPSTISSVQDDAYYSAKQITHPRIGRILIILVHYPSKLHMSNSDQKSFASMQSGIIEAMENRLNTKNTIVVGDFNFNPHEDAMLSADGMNAVSCSIIARKISRKIKGLRYRFFFNPMWSFYTKDSGVGHGTYYWNPKGYTSIYWNIFDQAIFRPQLIDDVAVKIIDRHQVAGSSNLDLLSMADHLPIKLTIKI
ncbi:MAG: hypothetical protein RLZZ398_863 [Verrucomicrobiota bacterium]|jgi:hypothetical protein